MAYQSKFKLFNPNAMDPKEAEQRQQLEVAFEINKLLNCGLDKETLSLCMGLLETGVNPEALADVIKEIRNEKERRLSDIGKTSTKEGRAPPEKR